MIYSSKDIKRSSMHEPFKILESSITIIMHYLFKKYYFVNIMRKKNFKIIRTHFHIRKL